MNASFLPKGDTPAAPADTGAPPLPPAAVQQLAPQNGTQQPQTAAAPQTQNAPQSDTAAHTATSPSPATPNTPQTPHGANTAGGIAAEVAGITLASVRKRTGSTPPKIIIYGCGGIGKTTLASEFPSPVFIQTEDGTGDLEISSFSDGAVSSFEQVIDCLKALAKEQHDFQTLVLDSVTRLEPMVWDFVCRQNRWASIEAPGFGKGYVEADKAWRRLMNAWNWLAKNKRMTIILIAHEDVRTFGDPTTDSYDRFQPRLHKRAEALLREDADVVGFMRQMVAMEKSGQGFDAKKSKARGAGQVAVYLRPLPSFIAKCRYVAAPAFVIVKPGEGYKALAPFIARKETNNG